MKKYLNSVPLSCAMLFIIGGLGAVMLTACMRLPAVSRNDYSGMGNDFFSVLIKKISIDEARQSGIDIKKSDQLSREFFLGKTYFEVNETFLQVQGHCDSRSQPNIFTCDVVRSWKRRDVLRPEIVTSIPKVKLVFNFWLSESKTVIDCALRVESARESAKGDGSI